MDPDKVRQERSSGVSNKRNLIAAGAAAALMFVLVGVPYNMLIGRHWLTVWLDVVEWLNDWLNKDGTASGFIRFSACLCEALAWLPPALVAIAVFELRRRPPQGDGFTHCGKCGYVLSGFSEVKCPECGKPI